MVYCANPFSQLVELFGKGNSIIGLRNIVPNDTVREFRLRIEIISFSSRIRQ